ncbi:MAG: aldolase [Clostridia bacterium]|nr:aldolase [Clostridia bacterium]
MNGKELREALHSGKLIYSTMMVSRSPKYPDTLEGLGLDMVFIDTEHNAIDRTTLGWMCCAYGAKNIAPVVRIPTHDIYDASMALDAGAAGVIVPYTEDIDTIRKMVGAVKYKPLKGEKLDAFLAGEKDLEPKLKEYLDNANSGHCLIVNIESVPAMDRLEELLAVPGLDAILIGPHDLSCSLGIPEEYDNPVYEAAVAEILAKARKAGLGSGIHVHYARNGLAQEIKWCRETGANLVVHHSDILSFALGMKRDLAALKAGIEGVGGSGEEMTINI